MALYSADVSAKILEWRSRANTLTMEECRQMVAAIRNDRGPAAAASGVAKAAKSEAAKKAGPVDTQALLSARFGAPKVVPAPAPIELPGHDDDTEGAAE